jgi:hypothetical protein
VGDAIVILAGDGAVVGAEDAVAEFAGAGEAVAAFTDAGDAFAEFAGAGDGIATFAGAGPAAETRAFAGDFFSVGAVVGPLVDRARVRTAALRLFGCVEAVAPTVACVIAGASARAVVDFVVGWVVPIFD